MANEGAIKAAEVAALNGVNPPALARKELRAKVIFETTGTVVGIQS